MNNVVPLSERLKEKRERVGNVVRLNPHLSLKGHINVDLSPEASKAIAVYAITYGMTPREVARDLLEAIVKSDLFDAVLEE